jgi:hypothetical protein
MLRYLSKEAFDQLASWCEGPSANGINEVMHQVRGLQVAKATTFWPGFAHCCREHVTQAAATKATAMN